MLSLASLEVPVVIENLELRNKINPIMHPPQYQSLPPYIQSYKKNFQCVAS